MIHHMKLKPIPFHQMKGGAKTIELRLYDPKRQQIKIGDQIEFTNTQDKTEKFRVKVNALHRFASFSELYRTLPLTACGYSDATKADPNDMNQYYSLEDQQKHEVVGIEVELVNWKDPQLEKTSRYISFLLRHHPEAAGLTLDAHGWANTAELIECVSKTRHITMTLLEQIVSTDEKQRYAFNADKSLIRANQGHSIPVDVELTSSAPPEKLWCIFRPSESKETVGVSPPSREKQVQVHGRESTGVLFGKKWQRNASQSAPPRVIYSDRNPFLLRMESSPSMRIL